MVGVYLTPTYTRAYPNGDLAANLVGFTTTTSAGDLRGQAGIEQSYNSLLAGRDGQRGGGDGHERPADPGRHRLGPADGPGRGRAG